MSQLVLFFFFFSLTDGARAFTLHSLQIVLGKKREKSGFGIIDKIEFMLLVSGAEHAEPDWKGAISNTFQSDFFFGPVARFH